MKNVNWESVKPSLLSSVFLFVYCFLLFPLMVYLVLGNKSILFEWDMVSISGGLMSVPLILDPIGVSFSMVVSVISACVMLFSSSYMEEEVFLSRFVWLVMMFVMSMNLLIFIPSSFALLLGWDGLGIVSFALIIYYQNKKSVGAGMLTALANRVGDVMLLTGVGLSLSGGHWNLLFFESFVYSGGLCCCLMIGAMTKSAQFPFCSWLPAAMAAPTPVSALVHSSTLVTAGVFLMIRFYYFLSVWVFYSKFLVFISIITLSIAGVGASVEFDLKKIIALSTLSQLGVMMFSLGMGSPFLSLFHLYTHALFKAMLFLCAGSVIHSSEDNQDLRKMGGLSACMPVTVSCLNVANLALCGAPFIGGFYSKDLILEMMFFGSCSVSMIILMMIATFLTCFYSFRMSCYSLWMGKTQKGFSNLSDESKLITVSMMILMLTSLLGSVMIQEAYLEFRVFILIPVIMKMSVLVVLILGLSMSILFVSVSEELKVTKSKLLMFVSLMWFLAPLSCYPLVSPFMVFSSKLFFVLDFGWFEKAGGGGCFSSMKSVTGVVREYQSSLFNFFILSFLMLVVFAGVTFSLIF